jgi:hypothetical protein
MPSRPSSTPSTTDPVNEELDRLIDRVGYSPKKTGELLSCGVTSVYKDVNAGLLDTYWDRGRKITGASIKRRIRSKLEAAKNQPLRRGGPGRPRKQPTDANSSRS